MRAEVIALMSSTIFHSPETIAGSPIPTFELQFVPARQTVLEFPGPSAKRLHDEALSKPDCIGGIRSALAIEAVAALLIYGVWQASHLLR